MKKVLAIILMTLTVASAYAQWLLTPYDPNKLTLVDWTTDGKALLNPHATATITTKNNIISSIQGTFTNSVESIDAVSALISVVTNGNLNYRASLNAHIPANVPATRINQFILTLSSGGGVNRFTVAPNVVPNQSFRATRHVVGDPDGVLVRVFIDAGCIECASRILSAITNIQTHPTRKRIEYHHAPVVSREIGVVAARAIECVTAANADAVRYWFDVLDNQVDWVNAGATNTSFLQIALRGGFGIEGVNACIDDPMTLLEVQNALEAARQLGVSGAVTVFVGGVRMVEPTDVTELNRLVLLALPEGGDAVAPAVVPVAGETTTRVVEGDVDDDVPSAPVVDGDADDAPAGDAP